MHILGILPGQRLEIPNGPAAALGFIWFPFIVEKTGQPFDPGEFFFTGRRMEPLPRFAREKPGPGR